jgi:hypothetical protein
MTPPWAKTTTRWSGVSGGDPPDGIVDAPRERRRRLGTGNNLPALLVENAPGQGPQLSHLLAQQAAVPFTEKDLAQVGLDDRLHSQAGQQRLRRLEGAAQRGDVDGVDAGPGQALTDLLGLLSAFGRQRRIALPFEQRKRPVIDERLRLAVADEEEVGGS